MTTNNSTKHVDATTDILLDWGSIPHTSTNNIFKFYDIIKLGTIMSLQKTTKIKKLFIPKV